MSGYEVQTISFQRQYPAWLYPGKSDKDPSQDHEEVSALFIADPLYFWTWDRSVREIVNFCPHMVIIQWWTTFWAPAFFFIARSLRQKGIPCIFSIHNVLPHEKRSIDVWLSRKVLSFGNAFVTLSPRESTRLLQLIPEAKVFNSQLPVRSTSLPHEDRSAVRKEMEIREDQTVLFFFGIVRAYKGLSVLLEALGLLKEEGLMPLLYVVGEFWDDVQKYQEQIQNLSISDQVRIINRFVTNEELSNFFAAADAFVAPHIGGTQSGAIRMAIGHGLPILASDQIISDLPLESYPILVHPSGNSAELARSIQVYLEQYAGKRYTNHESYRWKDLITVIDQVGKFVNESK